MKQSILVIDDSPDLLFLFRTVLEMDGFEVFSAQTGLEALSTLAQIERPHLILLDMYLEDMTGIDFIVKLEKAMPQVVEKVPIVFISGRDDVPPSKAVGFIRKPIEIEKFLATVRGFIREAK